MTTQRRVTTKAPAPPIPTDPVELLATPLHQSGLTAGNLLRRAGVKLGWYDVRDLLFHLPRRYDDLRELATIAQLRDKDDGEVVSVQATVQDVRVEGSFRRRVQRTVAVLWDGTGEISATWFGRRFIERRLHVGQEVVVSGRLKRFRGALTVDNPEFQSVDAAGEVLMAGRIVPVYRLTAGLTAARLRVAEREALDRAGFAYPEYLPPAVRKDMELPTIPVALEAAHYPTDFEARDQALDRLAFDELLALQLGMVGRRRARGRDAAPPVPLEAATDTGIREALRGALERRVGREVTLTVDQVVAIDQVRDDLARSTPMLRLLQGDVGSGKTAVAAFALAAAARAGLQGALLAPTDLL
ncbi:MAG: OB-fold nucleic acid binding domain-containing protein, partial [Chloroflexota bacterium]